MSDKFTTLAVISVTMNGNNNNNNNNGNFICVFECTIVNLTTYRQFTNAAEIELLKIIIII